ncbi:cysteine hydrolase family protein [Microbacterium stercoris]|uniref:cysteine hydrolase family protein n=1 Tax=Microbacterium stercoris TaxID=2820289 RepID=UPI0027DB3F08|nr:cysteine hydrolase family protein [Microbacterium stercoris]
MTTALIVIDMQQGFDDAFWGPTTNRPGCEDNVARLIEAWRATGDPIVVVRHDSTSERSPLNPANPGNSLMDAVAAADPAILVTKSVNSAFYGEPDLEGWLRGSGISRIVVCGIQTNMCVETTARMAGNLGFEVEVPIDATRTFDLVGPDGVATPAATLMAVTATNLHGGGFATVTTTDELIARGAR